MLLGVGGGSSLLSTDNKDDENGSGDGVKLVFLPALTVGLLVLGLLLLLMVVFPAANFIVSVVVEEDWGALGCRGCKGSSEEASRDRCRAP
jgi:hypothetical protein